MLRSPLLIWEFSVDNLPVLALKNGLRGAVFGAATQLFPVRPSPADSGRADRKTASRRCGAGQGVRGFWLGWGCGFPSFALAPQLSARRIGKLLSADAVGRARSPGVGFGVRVLGWE